jgi:hypothetical protein
VLIKTLKTHGFNEIERKGKKSYTKEISIEETLNIRVSKDEAVIESIFIKNQNGTTTSINESNFDFFLNEYPNLKPYKKFLKI